MGGEVFYRIPRPPQRRQPFPGHQRQEAEASERFGGFPIPPCTTGSALGTCEKEVVRGFVGPGVVKSWWTLKRSCMQRSTPVLEVGHEDTRNALTTMDNKT